MIPLLQKPDSSRDPSPFGPPLSWTSLPRPRDREKGRNWERRGREISGLPPFGPPPPCGPSNPSGPNSSSQPTRTQFGQMRSGQMRLLLSCFVSMATECPLCLDSFIARLWCTVCVQLLHTCWRAMCHRRCKRFVEFNSFTRLLKKVRCTSAHDALPSWTSLGQHGVLQEVLDKVLWTSLPLRVELRQSCKCVGVAETVIVAEGKHHFGFWTRNHPATQARCGELAAFVFVARLS